jgi:beta-glucanase (GH16 family)
MTARLSLSLSIVSCAILGCVAGCASSPDANNPPPNPPQTDGSTATTVDGGAPSTIDGSIPGGPMGGNPTEQTVTLKTSVANTYVGAENGGGSAVYADRFVPQAWETFKLVDLNGDPLSDGDAVNLRTNDGHFLSAVSGAVNAAATTAGPTETFTVGLLAKVGGASGNTIAMGDSISLKAGSAYLSATNGGGAGLVSTSTTVKSFETFLLGPAGGLPTLQSIDGWTLTWADEFNGPAGPIDGNKWTSEVNGNPANNELEFYTNRQSNIAVDGNGNLNLIARAEAYQGRNYTSGRVNTAGHFTQAYGRFDARIQMPTGKGIWPAFWMLGDNIGNPNVGWPQCGELDIMETVGTDTSHNYGSAHGPGYSGGNPLTGGYTYPGGSLTDGFHVFSLEWEPNVVRWYVDGTLFETKTSADVPPGTTWVYDHPFFVILNVAVGGTWPGSPDGTTVFPQTMKVDYVRIYKKK